VLRCCHCHLSSFIRIWIRGFICCCDFVAARFDLKCWQPMYCQHCLLVLYLPCGAALPFVSRRTDFCECSVVQRITLTVTVPAAQLVIGGVHLECACALLCSVVLKPYFDLMSSAQRAEEWNCTLQRIVSGRATALLHRMSLLPVLLFASLHCRVSLFFLLSLCSSAWLLCACCCSCCPYRFNLVCIFQFHFHFSLGLTVFKV